MFSASAISDNDGRFVLEPLLLGRQTAPVSVTLSITDRAGNLAAAPVTGNVVQRGTRRGSAS